MAITDTKASTITTKVFKDTDLETTSSDPVQVQLSATTLYSIQCANASSSATTYFKAYDSAGTVVVGSTDPVLTIPIKAAYDGHAITLGPSGLSFANGLQVTTDTTGGGTAGSTNPSDALTVTLIFA